MEKRFLYIEKTQSKIVSYKDKSPWPVEFGLQPMHGDSLQVSPYTIGEGPHSFPAGNICNSGIGQVLVIQEPKQK